MNILIFTEPDDIHAALVKLALEQKGVNCQIFFTADMPSQQRNSISFSNDNLQWISQSLDELPTLLSETHYDSVWFRRPRRPFIANQAHEADQEFVKRENQIYHDSIPFLLNADAWWVNPYNSLKRANSKIAQLKLATELGFRIPKTLVSNCPQTIKTFIDNSASKDVIYKSFTPQFWSEKKGLKLLYTSKITKAELCSDQMLQLVPGIYQHYIEKQFELRVTCFGSHISAVKIQSQHHPLGIEDWRKIPGSELSLEEYKLENSTKNKIINYMTRLGIVFGCFDFIVTKDDELYFLELNEQGQFLWIEELYPELHYLDHFVNFIINRSFNFNWQTETNPIKSSDLDAAAEALVHQNVKKHVYLNKIERVN